MSELFRVKTKWRGGLDGSGELAFRDSEFPFSVPKSLRGAGLGTNPEELLLGASAGCFLLTLGTVFSLQKIPVQGLAMESEIEVSTEKGIEIKKITHFPRVTLQTGISLELVTKANQAMARAETFCLISKAVQGNVKIEIIPTFEIEGQK